MAMDFARKMVIGKSTPAYRPHHDLNNKYTSDKPSYFEFVFEYEGNRYSYGFEVNLIERGKALAIPDTIQKKNALWNSIKSEWLYLLAPGKNYKIFDTSTQSRAGKKLSNSNGLMLGHSVGMKFIQLPFIDTESGYLQRNILKMFKDNYLIRMSESDKEFTPVPKGIIRFLRDNLGRFDTGITDVVEYPFINQDIPKNLIKDFKDDMTEDDQIVFIRGNNRRRHWLIHVCKDDDKISYSEVRFKHVGKYDARIEEESIGTRKIVQLMVLMASQMTMDNKGVIVVDEIECSIHALAIEEFVKMFKSPEMKGSQLIFTTHQSRILSDQCSVPDDIWFMDVKIDGDNRRSKLYALKTFKGDISQYGEMYFDGRFSAVPSFTTYDIGGDGQ